MAGFRTVFGIVRMNFYKWKNNAIIITSLFLLIVLSFAYLGRVPVYCFNNNYTCTPFMTSLLFAGGINSNGSFKVLFFFIAILFFNKAPFLDEQVIMMFTRFGRKRWMLGELVYILCAAAVFMCFFWITIVLPIIPCAEPNLHSFGSLPLKVLSDTTVHYEEGVLLGLILDASILSFIDPLRSAIYVTLIVYLEVVILALIIYAGNIYFPKKNLGITIAAFFVLLDAVLYALTGKQTRYLQVFSPISWCSVNFYKILNSWGVLNSDLIFILCFVWIFILCVIIWLKTRKMDIQISNID